MYKNRSINYNFWGRLVIHENMRETGLFSFKLKSYMTITRGHFNFFKSSCVNRNKKKGIR
jgi:hypothetical protein